MSEVFNIYCDESCHLENDGKDNMVLGAVWCPESKTREISVRIREIKEKHGLSPHLEIKWTKVSESKIDFYLDIIDYFFDDDDFNFRGLVADKTQLNHKKFSQDHDEWYYKMYFIMLKIMFDPESTYHIYLDIKDTLGGEKVDYLHNVLNNSQYDFSSKIIGRMQIVQSHHVEQMQVADLLIGSLSYLNNVVTTSKELSISKLRLIDRIKERSKYSLIKNTLAREKKFNLFYWNGNGDA